MPASLIARFEPIDLLKILGGLPEGKEYCADMVIHALTDALKNGQRKGNSQ